MSTALAVPPAIVTGPTPHVLDQMPRPYRFDRMPPFRPGKPFWATNAGHCCNTWISALNSRGWECAHGHVLWSSDLVLATIQAGEFR